MLFGRKVRLQVATAASEVVFTSLGVRECTFRAVDAARSVMGTEVVGIDASFSGSFSVRLSVEVGDRAGTGGDGRPQWTWWTTRSGRVNARLRDWGGTTSVKLVQGEKGGAPLFEPVSSSVSEGVIESALIDGFGSWGKLVTLAIPLVRGTWLVRVPTAVISERMIRDAVEGKDLDGILAAAFDAAKHHLDITSYGALVDDERRDETSTPLDAASLVPPSSTTSPPPMDFPLYAPSDPSTTSFRLHAHIIGPTLLHSFRLPNYSPALYRPGGTRAALQSFNLLTSEFKLEITKSSVSRLSFERASIAFDPPPPLTPEETRAGAAGGGIRGGVLVVTVQDLTVELVSDFKLAAETSSLISWTGMTKIGEKGHSKTIVEARTLQFRFTLVPSTRDAGSPFVLHSSSISPFTNITPSFELDNATLRLGAEVLNLVTAGLKTQIAQASSFVLGRFMEASVREQLQGWMDGIEETMRDSGVELPSDFRAGRSSASLVHRVSVEQLS
jgi:hypothetical protein